MDLPPEIVAKIVATQAQQRTSDGKSAGGTSGDCGSININSNDKKSSSGIKEMSGKQSTTVITGPVINMPKCK
jgi:hypothetical protein